jgi:hypothetical protein
MMIILAVTSLDSYDKTNIFVFSAFVCFTLLPIFFSLHVAKRAKFDSFVFCFQANSYYRGLTRATLDLLPCRQTLLAMSHSNGIIDCYSEPQLVLLQLPPRPGCPKLLIVAEFDSDADIFDWTNGGLNSQRGSKALEPLLREREQGARTSEPCDNCITSGSPLCRDLTRATYILWIEHPRLMSLSRESNPGPPALQANTQCKEPFERRY